MPKVKAAEVAAAVTKEYGHKVKPNMVYMVKTKLNMAADGRLERRRGARLAPFVFSGVQLLKKSLFDDVPEGAFSMNLIYDRLLETGRLYGLSHQGQWFHVGTPESVRDTEAMLGGG
jgi:MurNAc alpha-1-phosphate uridylyltransferase